MAAEKNQKKHRRDYNTVTGRARFMCNNARWRAKKAGVPFALTNEWVLDALLSGHCSVSGLPFSLTPDSPWAPSIDRQVPMLGYTKENCRVVVNIFNMAKNIWTDADVQVLACAISVRKRDE